MIDTEFANFTPGKKYFNIKKFIKGFLSEDSLKDPEEQKKFDQAFEQLEKDYTELNKIFLQNKEAKDSLLPHQSFGQLGGKIRIFDNGVGVVE